MPWLSTWLSNPERRRDARLGAVWSLRWLSNCLEDFGTLGASFRFVWGHVWRASPPAVLGGPRGLGPGPLAGKPSPAPDAPSRRSAGRGTCARKCKFKNSGKEIATRRRSEEPNKLAHANLQAHRREALALIGVHRFNPAARLSPDLCYKLVNDQTAIRCR